MIKHFEHRIADRDLGSLSVGCPLARGLQARPPCGLSAWLTTRMKQKATRVCRELSAAGTSAGQHSDAVASTQVAVISPEHSSLHLHRDCRGFSSIYGFPLSQSCWSWDKNYFPSQIDWRSVLLSLQKSPINSSVWHNLVWYGWVWFGLVEFNFVWMSLVWCGWVWFVEVKFSLVWMSLVWCGWVWFSMNEFGLVWLSSIWYG